MSNMIENTLVHYENKIKELEAKNGELEKKLTDAEDLNFDLKKQVIVNLEAELIIKQKKLDIAVEALERNKGGWGLMDYWKLEKETLAAINGGEL